MEKRELRENEEGEDGAKDRDEEEGERSFDGFPGAKGAEPLASVAHPEQGSPGIGEGEDGDGDEVEDEIVPRVQKGPNDDGRKEKFAEGIPRHTVEVGGEGVAGFGQESQEGEGNEGNAPNKNDGPGFRKEPREAEANEAQSDVDRLAPQFCRPLKALAQDMQDPVGTGQDGDDQEQSDDWVHEGEVTSSITKRE